MVDKVIICEKPSLGREVAKALQEINGVKAVSNSQYIQVGDDYVTWFAGHVYRQASPKKYYDGKWEKYSLNTLPIIVKNGDWIMEPDPNKLSLIKTARDLAKKANVIYNCGDPDREGQLLIDEALIEWGIDPFSSKVKRIWAQDLSIKVLTKAIESAYPNKEKQTLYEAGVARARADWCHGMTFSREFQLFVQMGGARDQKISVGRVQTPALSLIVRRDLERLNFKPVNHYKGEVTFKHGNGTFKTTWVMPSQDEMDEKFPGALDTEGRLINKDVVTQIINKVSGKSGNVTDFKNKLTPVPPPLGFELSSIQRDAGRKFNLTGKEVLSILQELYEKKITSYPRTDSKYLTSAIRDEQIDANFREMKKIPELASLIENCDMNLKSAIWNNSKVDSHYALIPASDFSYEKYESLTGVKKEIFMMIARRLIAQFYPPNTYYAMSATVECEGESFKGTGRQQKNLGWKVVYSKSGSDEEEEKDEDENSSFPIMEKGDSVTENGHREVAMTTTPPPAYNDANFVGEGGALEKAYMFETDPEIKKRLKEADGLGRPATRVAIVETLLNRAFIKRKGKTGLESTELGRSLIGVMPNKLISVGLTAIWESQLDNIEKGEKSLDEFMDELSVTLKEMVEEQIKEHPNGVKLKGVKTTVPLTGDGKPCPACKKAHREGGVMRTVEGISRKDKRRVKFLACSNNKKQEDGTYLCSYREMPVKKKMEGDGEPCPKCKEGILITREWKGSDGKDKRALRCNLGKEGCDFVKYDNPPALKVKNPKGPMKGDGELCPKCHKGHMKTREWVNKTTKEDSRAMFCDNEECKNAVWDNNIKPLPGDGDECDKCHKGKMITRSYLDKKTKKKERFLSCNRFPECKNAVFPKK